MGGGRGGDRWITDTFQDLFWSGFELPRSLGSDPSKGIKPKQTVSKISCHSHPCAEQPGSLCYTVQKSTR